MRSSRRSCAIFARKRRRFSTRRAPSGRDNPALLRKIFVEGQRSGNGAQGCSGQLIIEILLAMVQSIMNRRSMEELGMMPKEGFAGFLRLFFEGALTSKGRKA